MSYLTLADRIYAVCYVAIAAAVVESIAVNALVRRRSKQVALRVDEACRRIFPALLVLLCVLSTVRSFTQK